MAIRDTAAALRAAPTAALDEAAAELVALAEQVGGSMRGRPLTAAADVTGGATATLTLTGTPAGPWVWITDGTAPHLVGVKRRPGRGGRRVVMLAGADHPVMAPVAHPGARGRGAWRQVERAARKVAPAAVAAHVHRAVGLT